MYNIHLPFFRAVDGRSVLVSIEPIRDEPHRSRIVAVDKLNLRFIANILLVFLLYWSADSDVAS